MRTALLSSTRYCRIYVTSDALAGFLTVRLQVDPGSTILIKGEVQLKSDLPKECFTATYKPGDQMDYFSCADCKINCA